MAVYRRPSRREDEGFSIIELLVSIMLFSVVISVFIGATNSMFSSLRKQQGVADAADGNRRAFLLLEKQVRYASAINTPGLGTDGKYYVEWQAPNSAAQQTCVQWRLDPSLSKLQWRTWVITGGSVTAPAWTTVATGVVNDVNATTKPFALRSTTSAGVTLNYQQLQVHLESARNKPAGKAVTDTAFTALNTPNSAAPSPAVCQQVPRS